MPLTRRRAGSRYIIDLSLIPKRYKRKKQNGPEALSRTPGPFLPSAREAGRAGESLWHPPTRSPTTPAYNQVTRSAGRM
ncbi:hypothetical protein YTPLAS18_32730 [Nitrospira sp.]|nr:hypothetical protein YTPLAS18_32730 [Nitrospira sp.]